MIEILIAVVVLAFVCKAFEVIGKAGCAIVLIVLLIALLSHWDYSFDIVLKWLDTL